jgi:hypothetical protein
VCIYLNGILAGKAQLGLQRPDVGHAHPAYPDSETAGFELRNVVVPPGISSDIEIEARITLASGETAQLGHRLPLVTGGMDALAIIERHKDTMEFVDYRGIYSAFVNAGRLDDADQIVAAAASRFPNTSGPIIMAAENALRRENWSAAATEWAVLRTEFPDLPEGYSEGAAALMKIDRMEEASVLLQEAEHRFPTNAHIAVLAATICSSLLDAPEVHERWRLIQQRFPSNPIGYIRHSQIFLAEGNLEASGDLIRDLISKLPDSESSVPTSLAAVASDLVAAHVAENTNFDSYAWLIGICLNETSQNSSPGYIPQIIRKISSLIGIRYSEYCSAIRNYINRYRPVTSINSESDTVFLARAIFAEIPFFSLDRLWKIMVNSDKERLLYFLGPENINNVDFFVGKIKTLTPTRLIDICTDSQLFNITLAVSALDSVLYREVLNTLRSKRPLSGTSSPYLRLLINAAILSDQIAMLPRVRISRKRQLSIALCISGQLRGYEDAFRTWQDLNIVKHNVETFVHTWDTIGTKSLFANHAHRAFSGHFMLAFKDAAIKIGHDSMESRYPRLFGWFKAEAYVSQSQLSALYRTDNIVIEEENSVKFQNFTNSEKMYYKVWACSKLIEDKYFDLIIRIRPDRAIASAKGLDWNEIYCECAAKPLIFTDYPHTITRDGLYIVGDQFAVGTMESMRIYNETYIFSKKASEQNLPGFPQRYLPHLNFAYTLFCHGIETRQLPGLEFGAFCEPQKMDDATLEQLLIADSADRLDDPIDGALLDAHRRDMHKFK